MDEDPVGGAEGRAAARLRLGGARELRQVVGQARGETAGVARHRQRAIDVGDLGGRRGQRPPLELGAQRLDQEAVRRARQRVFARQQAAQRGEQRGRVAGHLGQPERGQEGVRDPLGVDPLAEAAIELAVQLRRLRRPLRHPLDASQPEQRLGPGVGKAGERRIGAARLPDPAGAEVVLGGALLALAGGDQLGGPFRVHPRAPAEQRHELLVGRRVDRSVARLLRRVHQISVAIEVEGLADARVGGRQAIERGAIDLLLGFAVAGLERSGRGVEREADLGGDALGDPAGEDRLLLRLGGDHSAIRQVRDRAEVGDPDRRRQDGCRREDHPQRAPACAHEKEHSRHRIR